ncbi:hypothetical protein [Longimicrobium sp.]|uniref:hypothetical protein n=1 Tax=Longimicrobium sp. TaxID=2029185 RepID=UPI002E31D1D4|nr:hypothetical protein [Longimicrobium sp.]HEX6041109.1 hypothetical protein [Longimicrobium sp.]
MRILVWNIQFFTDNRISGQPGGTVQQTAANAEGALANLLYIISTVEQTDPDVFVVLETLSSQGGLGTLGTGGGPDGVLGLLAELRGLHSTQWFAVPPLRVNPHQAVEGRTYTESVGVFWRDDRVRFDGPWSWPAGATNAVGPSVPGAGAAGTYPAPWDAAVPAGTTAAAQYTFTGANGQEILFTGQGHRRPYLTTFTERNGAQRRVNLFSVHTKPGTTAGTAVARLGQIMNAGFMPNAGEVVVFAGDFNVDVRNPNAVEWAQVAGLAFSRLTPVAISPTPAANPPSIYYPRRSATPGQYRRNELLDWALVSYGAGALPAPVLPLLVLDRVAGTAPGGGLPAVTRDMGQTLATIQAAQPLPTYAIAPAPGGAVRAGAVTTITTATVHALQAGDTVRVAGVADGSFNGDFAVTAAPTARTFTYAQPATPGAASGGGTADTPFPAEDLFRQRWNFGHIGPPANGTGTSDHLPIFFIV